MLAGVAGKTLFPDAATIVVYGEQFLSKTINARTEFLHRQEHIYLLPVPADENEPLPWLLAQLNGVVLPERFAKSSIQSVLLEGGPRLLAQFFRKQLIDVVHLFIAPYLGGGNRHRFILPAPLIEKLDLQLMSNNVIVDEASDDLLVEYLSRSLMNKLVF